MRSILLDWWLCAQCTIRMKVFDCWLACHVLVANIVHFSYCYWSFVKTFNVDDMERWDNCLHKSLDSWRQKCVCVCLCVASGLQILARHWWHIAIFMDFIWTRLSLVLSINFWITKRSNNECKRFPTNVSATKIVVYIFLSIYYSWKNNKFCTNKQLLEKYDSVLQENHYREYAIVVQCLWWHFSL